VNGNDTVGVIDAVSEDLSATGRWGRPMGRPIARAHSTFRSSTYTSARIEFLARSSAMESTAHLDVMRVDEVIDPELYARGVELLERIVAMRMKLIDP